MIFVSELAVLEPHSSCSSVVVANSDFKLTLRGQGHKKRDTGSAQSVRKGLDCSVCWRPAFSGNTGSVRPSLPVSRSASGSPHILWTIRGRFSIYLLDLFKVHLLLLRQLQLSASVAPLNWRDPIRGKIRPWNVKIGGQAKCRKLCFRLVVGWVISDRGGNKGKISEAGDDGEMEKELRT